ncbi:MAG: Omp28-related outer membrane protein [Sphingobacteriales bacterium]|nr:MAG: Omp28-related outer membrane protein [Sphingobacteriales bacterium]
MEIKAFFQLAIYGILLTLSACEEKNDLINFKTEEFNTLKLDSSYQSATLDSAQPKNVLLEDFTAIRCVNCPRAQKEAKKIQDENPGRVVVSSVHVSDLAIPYKESKYDFRTTDAENLLAYLGGVSGLPTGAIDRKLYGSNTKPFVLDYQWKAFVKQQLAIKTPVNIDIIKKEPGQDGATKFQIKVTYTEAVNSPQYLSAFINESAFTDLQLTTVGVDSNYTHNHAFRGIMQPSSGLKLGDNFTKGQTFLVNIAIKTPENWKTENCHLSAFIHNREGNFEVIHIQETELK